MSLPILSAWPSRCGKMPWKAEITEAFKKSRKVMEQSILEKFQSPSSIHNPHLTILNVRWVILHAYNDDWKLYSYSNVLEHLHMYIIFSPLNLSFQPCKQVIRIEAQPKTS